MLEAALCVVSLAREGHREGELALPATSHPARCGVGHRLCPITNVPCGGAQRSLSQASRQLQQIKLRFKVIPVRHRWMAEPSGLDVGSCVPGREALGSDLSCWGATKSPTKSSVGAAGLIMSVPLTGALVGGISDCHISPIPPSADAK